MTDKITNDNTLTLTGSAAANAKNTVKVDGSQHLLSTANASGAWSFTTSALADAHSLSLQPQQTPQAIPAQHRLAVTIDTVAPIICASHIA